MKSVRTKRMAIKVLMMRWPILILTLFMLFGNDMYRPEYTMQWICEAIQKHDIDAESHALLDEGHKEILQSECYEDYGVSSYIDK